MTNNAPDIFTVDKASREYMIMAHIVRRHVADVLAGEYGPLSATPQLHEDALIMRRLFDSD